MKDRGEGEKVNSAQYQQNVQKLISKSCHKFWTSGLSVMQNKHVRVQRHLMQRRWTKVSSQRVDNRSQRCLTHKWVKNKSTDPIQQVQLHSSNTCMCCIPHAISLNRSVHARTINHTQCVRKPGMTTGRAWSLLLSTSLVWIYSLCKKRVRLNDAIQYYKLLKHKTLARISGSSVPLQIHAHCSH